MTQTTETTGFPDKLYKSDCEDAKSHIGYPLSQEYVARLEHIAYLAHKHLLYANSGDKVVRETSRELANALNTINYMR